DARRRGAPRRDASRTHVSRAGRGAAAKPCRRAPPRDGGGFLSLSGQSGVDGARPGRRRRPERPTRRCTRERRAPLFTARGSVHDERSRVWFVSGRSARAATRPRAAARSRFGPPIGPARAMSLRGLDRLALGLRKRLPVLLQTEAAECALACLAMIASYHGQ